MRKIVRSEEDWYNNEVTRSFLKVLEQKKEAMARHLYTGGLFLSRERVEFEYGQIVGQIELIDKILSEKIFNSGEEDNERYQKLYEDFCEGFGQ